MTWTVRLHTIPEDKVEALLEYCRQAREVDSTFTFVEDVSPTGSKWVIINCESKDQAYKRGVLFHSRFGCFFEVEWK